MEHLLVRMGGIRPQEDDARAFLQWLTEERFIDAVEVFGHLDRAMVGQVNDDMVYIYLPSQDQRFRCDVCSWPLAGSWDGAPCPRCDGTAAPWSDATVRAHRTVRRVLEDRNQPLNAAEHTAQVTTQNRVDLEENFKATQAESPLNVLACSPTMEMGIDVGGLDAVLLRNVPPRPDNYAQRGGRAGRRTRTGLVVAYARNTPHDQYFYDHPEEMISGEIPAPFVSLSNRDVIFRHLCSMAIGAAEPGLAGRMQEYVSPQGQINETAVTALLDAVQARAGHALELAGLAWGADILDAARLSPDDLRRHLESLPARIRRVMEATALQVNELRRALDAYAASVIGRRMGTRAADLVARLLGIPTEGRGNSPSADDTSAGYPLRRLAEFGILPGYEFPSEPASLRLLGDPNEENPVNAARRFGIYQFMPEAPVYARNKRWKVAGLDMSSPWNPRSDAPWDFRICRTCGLRFATSHPRCPRCTREEVAPSYPAFEYGGFLAVKNEAPILDEEDRIPARNLVKFYPQWDGEVYERWSVGPGWQLRLSREEEVRWVNEGLPPSPVDLRNGTVLHNEASGFTLCPSCGRNLTPPPPTPANAGRARAANRPNQRDPFGHSEECPQRGQPPRYAAIVTSQRADVLRLQVVLPAAMGADAILEWSHSLGAALRAGMRHHLLLDDAEIEFEPEGPWEATHDAGAWQRLCLTFVDASVGGSGYIPRIARDLHLIARQAIRHLDHPNCETACYRCLKSYQNQRHHEHLKWPLIMADLESLAEAAPESLPLQQGDTLNPAPWLEAFAAGVGSPLELRFLRLFQQHGFDPQRQVAVSPDDGPPISIADFAVPERRLAIYIDGAAFHTGQRLRRDRWIRNRLREGPRPWRVAELRASDLARGRSLVAELQSNDV